MGAPPSAARLVYAADYVRSNAEAQERPPARMDGCESRLTNKFEIPEDIRQFVKKLDKDKKALDKLSRGIMTRSQVLRLSLTWTYLNSKGAKAPLRVFLYRMFPRTYFWLLGRGWVSELWATRPYG